MYKELIIQTCKDEGLLRNQCAYVLATADWETAHTFEPVREAFYLGAKKAEAYRKKLRYSPFYGRGFVQLTWRGNYDRAGREIGVDLVSDPDAAMEPNNAALILVRGMKQGWFTGKKLSDFITLRRSDFAGARRIVNGIDRQDEIAQLARKYNAELVQAGYGVETPPEPVLPPTDDPRGKSDARGWTGLLILALTAISGAAIALWQWASALIERMF